MPIRKYKPTTPGRRGASVADFAEVTRPTPEKSLLVPLHSKGGRNVHGRITTRHQGGGHKRQYRLIDFKRVDKDGVPAKVAHIEYDPNRTARIALLHYLDGEKRYILCPKDLRQGARVEAGPGARNPIDHPHGGSEGKTSGGRHPVNPQGKPEGRTRRKGQPSDRLIVRRRYANRKRG